MANAQRLERGEIPDHAPVVGSDGRPVGMVDRVEGEYLKLMRGEAGEHRWLPRSTVAGLEGGLVRLSLPALQAPAAMLGEAEVAGRLASDPDAGPAFGRPEDDAPHGSRAHAHGGPKGKRQHGQSGSVSGNRGGPPGQTSFGVSPNRK
ncbi:DUF2171 domain-containing protein [Siccirubricoccus phaeus]|uniref:DUF2171 domain-containing protein n=1 Tax=Siccirubricoccus phaeus TaxID=2595053 RepID=UPI0011F25098|nr:DUF2171 domain-containing protein [Siccirubricoccus phaeus]